MIAAALVSDLRQRGVAFSIKGSKLVLDAPKGVLDDSTVATLREGKSAILAYLGSEAGKPTSRTAWSDAEWKAYFDERAGSREHEGEQPRPLAEAAAFEDCIDEWLRQNPPPPAQPNQCAQCCKPDDGEGQTVLLGTAGHTWLHHRCHHAWKVLRWKEAVQALACVDPLAADER